MTKCLEPLHNSGQIKYHKIARDTRARCPRREESFRKYHSVDKLWRAPSRTNPLAICPRRACFGRDEKAASRFITACNEMNRNPKWAGIWQIMEESSWARTRVVFGRCGVMRQKCPTWARNTQPVYTFPRSDIGVSFPA